MRTYQSTHSDYDYEAITAIQLGTPTTLYVALKAKSSATS